MSNSRMISLMSAISMLSLALPIRLLLIKSPEMQDWVTKRDNSCKVIDDLIWMNGKELKTDLSIENLFNTGLIFQNVCSPGFLSFRAIGIDAENVYPIMTVSISDKTILTTRVVGERSFKLYIPESGVLSISFHNDFFSSEVTPPQDRNLFIRDKFYKIIE